MDSFIAESLLSKEALRMATIASSLPVNVLIAGEVGVGKKALARVVSNTSEAFDSEYLQDLISTSSINLSEHDSLIVHDIDKLNNIRQFLEKLDEHHVKIIATTTMHRDSFEERFPVKIELAPLVERKEDLKILSQRYIEEANKHFCSNVLLDDIDIDLSKNGISLKESIYRGVVFASITEEQIYSVLEKFLYKMLDNKTKYRELVEIFEIPLIKACRKKYKSQLQMANHLDINRNTLRKKILQYKLEDR